MKIYLVFLLIIVLSLSSGCAMFRTYTEDVDVNNMEHFRGTYDATDMKKITDTVVNNILEAKMLKNSKSPPIMVISGIQNRTREYVDTKNLTDRIRTKLINSGKVKFVNAARRDDLLKEQGYQAANVTPETMVSIGRQIGARYMITGSLTQMTQETGKQVRISSTEMNYYKLTIEVTDLETSLIEWTTEVEFARKESTPLIGW